MNNFTLLIVALIFIGLTLSSSHVQATEQDITNMMNNSTTSSSSTHKPTLKIDEGKRAFINMNNNRMINFSKSRGVSANCQYDNTNQDIKIFKCKFGFSKKILSQNIQGTAESSLAVNLKEHNAVITISTNNQVLYKNTFTLGDVIPPICADVFFQVGLCLKLSNVKFHSTNPQCFKMDLQAYLQAFTYHEVILTEPIGYNANLC